MKMYSLKNFYRFINQLLKLLLSYGEKYNSLIQKHVKDLVGLETSPSLYPILFDQIKAIVDKFFDQQGQVSISIVILCVNFDCFFYFFQFIFLSMKALLEPGNTQFIEQIVCIMKTVLEKKIDEPCENFGATSIEGMILTIVR